MFYFRVKATEMLLSVYHGIKYKSNLGRMLERRRIKGRGSRAGGGGV